MINLNIEVDAAPADAECSFCSEPVGNAGGWRIVSGEITVIGCKRCKERPSDVLAEMERLEEARGSV